MEVYAENARNGVYVVEEAELIAKLEDKYGYTIQPEPTGGITGITVKQNGTIVNTTTVATVEKADNTPAEVSATLTVVPTPGEGSEYYIVEDGIYYKISLSGEVITIGEGQESVGEGTGSSSPTVEVTNKASLTKIDEPQISGLTITIVGRTAGDETLEISYSGKTATVKVTVTQTFAVNFYASSTGAEATLVKVADGGNALTATNYTTAKSAADSAAPEGQVFDKWVLKTAVGANTVGSDATSLLGEVTQDLNVYATFKNPPIAFRSYGEARNTGAYGNAYSIGTITVNGVTIADNWKIFYEDDDFIYVIYGDYYPAGAQTEITDGNAIFAPAHTSSSSYQTDSTKAYSVNSGASRTTLLGYLRNHSGYSWNTTSPYGDNYGSGTTYESWNDLKNAISGLSSMSGKTISVQGSPDIDLWVNSWNAKYGSGTNSAKLKVTKKSNGYNIMEDKDTVTSNSNYYINVTQSPYNGANDDTNGKGYYDTLYFPYRGNTDKANCYWLASPGANLGNALCNVGFNGDVYCNYGYSSSGCSARPVVSIAK